MRRSKNYLVLFLIVVFAARVAAYDHPLESTAIREAYFLGTSTDKSVRFLAAYVRHLPLPKTGPYVSEIEVQTPYAQVVALSRGRTVGYSAQEAERDYNEDPDVFRVRVAIRFTPTYSLLTKVPLSACEGVSRMRSGLDCFHDFRFHIRQQGELPPKSTYGVPYYDGNGTWLGGDLWFEFGTDQMQSAPLRVEVFTPDGQKVTTAFDLANLR